MDNGQYRIYWRTKVHVAFQSMGRAQAGKWIRYTRSKASGFNVSSAYVLKGDMDLCPPVDVVLDCYIVFTVGVVLSIIILARR